MDIKENSGVMFNNQNWTEGSKQPRVRGEINVGGKIMEIAMWVKKSANGNTYYSVQLKDKEEYHKPEKKSEPMERTTYPSKGTSDFDMDDGIPFDV